MKEERNERCVRKTDGCSMKENKETRKEGRHETSKEGIVETIWK